MVTVNPKNLNICLNDNRNDFLFIHLPSGRAFKLTCCISECLAQIIFPPFTSMDIAGSSLPTLIIMVPSSYLPTKKKHYTTKNNK